MNLPIRIVMVGAGRIATHLGRRLRAKGLRVVQVLNRSAAPAQALATELQADWSDDWSNITPQADWVILAVRDDAIADVGAQLSQYAPDSLFTHTSGATPGAVLAPYCRRYGVFYPLQSFSAEHVPLWSKVPFCVDASQAEDLAFLKKIAKIIGNLVYHITDEQRAVLHIAAVFANNFANHCFAVAERIMEQQGLPFEMLHPLMEETLIKALLDSPEHMQTGPAARGDMDTIQRHLQWLQAHPLWRDLYVDMSRSINPALPLGEIEAHEKLKVESEK
ncbi:MAG: DUF2520 domain-containing protein [Saprospiraceae bacterium]|nr:DUF2520 domain-containing protein [Saprospiraceae bacterium]MDW8230550.1 DUF2520 domain-containing protein [Saprospiraceae bacterium]